MMITIEKKWYRDTQDKKLEGGIVISFFISYLFHPEDAEQNNDQDRDAGKTAHGNYHVAGRLCRK